MRTVLTRSLFAAALALVVTTACGYSPNPASGTLQCGSSNTCPEGYSCRSGLCWKDGAGGSGGNPNTAKFDGVWVFNAALSTRTRDCTDGTHEVLTPWDDYFNVAEGPVAALSADYYCVWNLDVNGSGTQTAIRSGTMCTKPDPNVAGTSYTWHGESFTLTTTNGTSGMLEASLPYDYTTTGGSGTCTMKFTGAVSKP